MKIKATIVDLRQGTPEWMAHRTKSLNASELAAAMGLSSYVKRSDLIAQKSSGIVPEVDAATQQRFDKGHEFEAIARPWAEEIIGDALYPCVLAAEVDGLLLSASLDGQDVMSEVTWEHKTARADLLASLEAGVIPEEYHPQMEQGLMLSGASRCLFMASNGTRESMRFAWYESRPDLRAKIIPTWKQFQADIADHQPRQVASVVVAAPVQSLPSVTVNVTGQITITDNFAAFQAKLQEFLDHHLIREPKTDEDFVTLDVQIKAMKGAEAALDAAEGQMLAQIASVDTAKKTKDMLAKLVRDNRLMAEKLLASEKDRRRGEIVAGGVKALQEHVAGLNARLGEPWMPQVPADFGGAIKGKKSLSSMEDAVATELARAKIAANEVADRIQANMQALAAAGDAASFPDARNLVLKAPDDLAAVIAQRVAETQRRLEEQRERIRQEEAAKLQREQAAREAEAARVAAAEQRAREQEAARIAEAANQITQAQPPQHVLKAEPATAEATDRGTAVDVSPRGGAMGAGQAAAAAPVVVQLPPRSANEPPTLKLGTICERLGFTMTSAFVSDTLGIQPAATDKAAKLYRESDWSRICVALIRHVETMQRQCGQQATEARA